MRLKRLMRVDLSDILLRDKAQSSMSELKAVDKEFSALTERLFANRICLQKESLLLCEDLCF